MNKKTPLSLVSVYSSPVEFDAGIVKAMLADQGIESTIENTSGPFMGIAAAPCQLFVSTEDELKARELIEQHEIQHLKRIRAKEKKSNL